MSDEGDPGLRQRGLRELASGFAKQERFPFERERMPPAEVQLIHLVYRFGNHWEREVQCVNISRSLN